MSINNGDPNDRVFKTKERRDSFWTEFNELMARYPETSQMPETAFEDDGEDEEGKRFDPAEPVVIDGTVIVYSVRNASGYELMVVIDPPRQSTYVTKGLIATADEVS